MARPVRNDCDYFPFYVKEGKTFTLLRRRWPLLGIGFFTELCIILTRTPEHHLQLKTSLDLEYAFAGMGADPSLAEEILSFLAETGKIDRPLWEEGRVVVIPDLLNSLEYAYSKRSVEIVRVIDLRIRYLASARQKEWEESNRDGNTNNRNGNDSNRDNPEEKPEFQGGITPEVKESKGKESKEEVVVSDSASPESNPTPASKIISYFNEKTGLSIRDVEPWRKLIRARMKEGAQLEDFQAVIDSAVRIWLPDRKMKQYVHPKTLFRVTNFWKYVDAGVTEKPEDNPEAPSDSEIRAREARAQQRRDEAAAAAQAGDVAQFDAKEVFESLRTKQGATS